MKEAAGLVGLFLLLCMVFPADALTQCLRLPEVTPKRFVNFQGQTIELTLGASDRVVHRLVTHVFQIFLSEVLGYPGVQIVRTKDTSIAGIFEDLSENFDSSPQNLPNKYMVNLEVWLPPDLNTIHLLETKSVRECGNIAPPGRYSWLIPKNLSKPEYEDWRIFKQPEKAKLFSLTDNERMGLRKYTFSPYNVTNEKYFCSEKYCKNGFYTPDKCRGRSCAVLITTFPSETGFVIKDIERFSLLVEVVWVGPHLRTVVNNLKSRSRTDGTSLIFLTHTPSVLTLGSEHVSVSFPPCDEYSNNVSCHYSSIRLVKLAWSHLVTAARPAYEALQKMELTTDDYKDLVEDYLYTGDMSQVACSWMKRHNDTYDSWRQWMPSDDERNELYIGGIFPLTTNETNSYTARGIVHSSLMAIDAVNANNQILRDYKLKLLLDDGQCQSDVVMKTFIDYILMNKYERLVGILGPACSDTVEPLAGVSKHFKTVVISYSAEGSIFSRDKYPYFFRTIGENKNYKYVYLKLLQELEWKRVASLTEDGTKYTEYISHTQDLLQANGINFVANRKFPHDWENDAMKQYLDELKHKNARIIIADVKDEAARSVMCEAYHRKMTAYEGWVWFLPHWLSPKWYEIPTNGNKTIKCTTEEMKMAINGYLALTHQYFAADSEIMQENITVGEWRAKYRKKQNNGSEESNYAGYAYDAVWAYAYALDKLIKFNESYASSLHMENTTRKFVELIQKTNFNGVSGHIMFSSGPSRISNVDIMQWINDELHIIGNFHPNKNDKNNSEYALGRLSLNKSKIIWLNKGGTLPWDGTVPEDRCLLEGFANLIQSTCQTAIVVANIIGIFFLLLIVVISFLIVRHKYEKKVKITQKYMKSWGIDLLSASTINSLDKWEISRDKIVINRKLGEGAFGFVYGGEAHLNEKGWVAVAVKTLKVGSSTEEKLDFLAEAEVMKRFEHKNIVQLLGVCTKNEPVYTIMEFMLYGDLKTFLLARRHLVNEKYPDETDEISCKKLTNMALDVARALSYLAELKYVHRDVASRNCLVNVNKVVKLGDFGMTRPMCESDYYRFNRKGMLPVRWMAPESLVLGVFTPASDVWSYGVLLYEIITFGSFPFQGLSNNQVLEFVKAGNTLSIPEGIKPQLESLIRSCWLKEYKKRPPASEIVESLANNPRLLSPCLDVPLSSVQMEDTGEISITGGSRGQRFSMGLRQRSSSHEIAEPLLSSPGRYRPTRGSSLGEEPQDSLL